MPDTPTRPEAPTRSATGTQPPSSGAGADRATGAGRASGRAWGRAGARLGRTRLVTAIRSSLALRIAVSITAAGVLVVLIFSVVTSGLLRSSVFDSRRDAVLDDAAVRFTAAQALLDQSTASTPAQVQEAARQTVENIQASAAGAGAVSAMLLRPADSDQASGGIRINEIVNSAYLPLISEEMRAAVEADSQAQWQSVLIPGGEDTPDAPGILVGITVELPRAGTHELYIVYSLRSDQAVVDLVMRVFTVVALPILAALPIAVFWVLFHLLAPVTRTADAATRIADGDLDARVRVEGSDEMARLGSAFNDMASSLQRQIVEYDELARLQQRFVSDVSHELRTPLTTIRMAEEMIWDERESLSAAGRRSAELLHGQVERFESMLADLLEISRHDAQSALLEAETTDIRAVVAKVVAANGELADRLGVDVEVEAPDVRCGAEMDSRRIERVLRNLLVNAIEHAEGRPVVLTVGVDATSVAVRVRDHGVGMSEDTVAHVFDRFFRADPARTRTTGGTGLGLSIAAEDVALHHGSLRAWGELGVGSSFLLVLPRSQSTPAGEGPLALWEDQ